MVKPHYKQARYDGLRSLQNSHQWSGIGSLTDRLRLATASPTANDSKLKSVADFVAPIYEKDLVQEGVAQKR